MKIIGRRDTNGPTTAKLIRPQCGFRGNRHWYQTVNFFPPDFFDLNFSFLSPSVSKKASRSLQMWACLVCKDTRKDCNYPFLLARSLGAMFLDYHLKCAGWLYSTVQFNSHHWVAIPLAIKFAQDNDVPGALCNAAAWWWMWATHRAVVAIPVWVSWFNFLPYFTVSLICKGDMVHYSETCTMYVHGISKNPDGRLRLSCDGNVSCATSSDIAHAMLRSVMC